MSINFKTLISAPIFPAARHHIYGCAAPAHTDALSQLLLRRHIYQPKK